MSRRKIGVGKIGVGLGVLSAMALMTGFGMSMSGCLPAGCDLRDFPLTIPFGSGIPITASILGGVPGSGAAFTNVEIPLGNGDNCQIEGIDDLLETINNVGGGLISSIIQIDSITVDNITLTATNAAPGNFDFITNLRVEILATGGTSSDRTFILETDAIGGDELILTAQNEIDLWSLLQDGFDCISGRVIISGNIPDEDVIFDGTLHITIHPVLSLRPLD